LSILPLYVSGYENGVGLFGYSTGIISNIGLTDLFVGAYGVSPGGAYVGGLVGYLLSGTVSNSYTMGYVQGGFSVEGDYVGGLVGYNDGGEISSSYTAGTVTGSNQIGGLVGGNNGGSINKSYATESISAAGIEVGGLVGSSWNSGVIDNSYSIGSVYSIGGPVGGLVGDNQGTIMNSFSAGTVDGNTIGGLIGYQEGALALAINSFWDVQTSSQAVMCGVGSCDDSYGKTTAQMNSIYNFNSFSGANWDIQGGEPDLNSGYPYLFMSGSSPTWLIPAINDGKLYDCGTITESGVYTLQNDVSSTGTCFTVTADDVVLDGNSWVLTYNTNNSLTGTGIYIPSSQDNITIKDFSGINDGSFAGDDGIHADYSLTNSYISNNQINVDNLGIYLNNYGGSSENTTIINNIIDSGFIGIALTASSSNIIGNSIISYDRGIDFHSGSLSSNNVISGNSIESQYYSGIFFSVPSSNNIINGSNTINAGTMGCLDNNYYCSGIVYSDTSTNDTIDGNKIDADMDQANGVYYYSGSTNNVIRGNQINASMNGGYGIDYKSVSSYDTLESNTINSNNGMRGPSLSHGILTGNNISSSYYGFVFVRSYNNTLIDNIIIATGLGLSFGNSSYDTLIGNDVYIAAVTPSDGGAINIRLASNDVLSGNTITSEDHSGIVLGGFSGNNIINGSNIISAGTTACSDMIYYCSGIVYTSTSTNDTIDGNTIDTIYSAEGKDLWISSGKATNLTIRDQVITDYNIVGLSNISFIDSNYGSIKLFNMNGTGTNFIGNSTSDIQIGNNSAYVNSSQAGLNKSANITFYNLPTRYNPYIKGINESANGTCTSCYIFSSAYPNTIFNVTSWTPYNNYSIRDRIAFLNLSYSPNTTDGIDPGINITVNLTVPESPDFSISNVLLQLFNGTDWVNYSSDNLTNGEYGIIFPLADDEIEYNYTFNVWANNSDLEESQSSNMTFNATWDCSFIIMDSYGNLSDGDLGTVGGFNTQRPLGNITINNTGDANYSDGCSIKFGRDSSANEWYTNYAYGLNFSRNYSFYILSSDFPGELRGLRYYNESNSITSVTLGPKENVIVDVEGIFPNIEGVLTEYPYFSIFANKTDTVDGETNKTIHAKMVVTPGAYLESVITTPVGDSLQIPLAVGNYSFIAYVRDIVAGADNPNNTAYDVSLNWTLPEEVQNRSSSENFTFFNSTLNDTSFQYVNFTLQLNVTNLASMTTGTQTVYTYAKGYENSTGSLLPISQGIVSDSVILNFTCVEESDGICVASCRPLTSYFRGVYFNSSDSDCGYCGDGISANSPGETCETCPEDVGTCPVASNGGAGGGGGGGGAGGSFAKSETTFELVRGENQYFDLVLENKLASPKKNITITIKGNNSQYVTPQPSTVSYLDANSKETIKFRINAPSYFSSGKYLLEITFAGNVLGNTSTKFTEVRYVTLTILEMPRKEADGYVNASLETLSKMNSSGFILDEVNALLASMNSNYGSLNFNSLKEGAAKIEEIYTAATEYLKLKVEMNQSILESERNGVSVAETKKLFYLAEILFNRGDYVAAYAKLKEAKSSYLLETKGEFKILYAIKNNPGEFLAIVLSISAVGVGSGYFFRFKMLKRKLRMLAEEEVLLLQLMRVVQRDCFEGDKMSMEEYNEAMYQYEARLSSIIQEKVTAETTIANLMRVGGKKKALSQEKDRLITLVKQIQEDYLNRGKIDTRVYENMLKTYASRLNKIEEELVFMEAQEQIRKVNGFWKNLFSKN